MTALLLSNGNHNKNNGKNKSEKTSSEQKRLKNQNSATRSDPEPLATIMDAEEEEEEDAYDTPWEFKQPSWTTQAALLASALATRAQQKEQQKSPTSASVPASPVSALSAEAKNTKSPNSPLAMKNGTKVTSSATFSKGTTPSPLCSPPSYPPPMPPPPPYFPPLRPAHQTAPPVRGAGEGAGPRKKRFSLEAALRPFQQHQSKTPGTGMGPRDPRSPLPQRKGSAPVDPGFPTVSTRFDFPPHQQMIAEGCSTTSSSSSSAGRLSDRGMMTARTETTPSSSSCSSPLSPTNNSASVQAMACVSNGIFSPRLGFSRKPVIASGASNGVSPLPFKTTTTTFSSENNKEDHQNDGCGRKKSENIYSSPPPLKTATNRTENTRNGYSHKKNEYDQPVSAPSTRQVAPQPPSKPRRSDLLLPNPPGSPLVSSSPSALPKWNNGNGVGTPAIPRSTPKTPSSSSFSTAPGVAASFNKRYNKKLEKSSLPQASSSFSSSVRNTKMENGNGGSASWAQKKPHYPQVQLPTPGGTSPLTITKSSNSKNKNNQLPPSASSPSSLLLTTFSSSTAQSKTIQNGNCNSGKNAHLKAKNNDYVNDRHEKVGLEEKSSSTTNGGLRRSLHRTKANFFNNNDNIHQKEEEMQEALESSLEPVVAEAPKMDRAEAESLLADAPIGTYLLRIRVHGGGHGEASPVSPFPPLALSLRSTQGVLHIKLERREEDGVWVLGEGPRFHSVSALLRTYRRTELPVRGAEHVRLGQQAKI